MSSPRKKQLRIAMVCDFFYPRLGGVENHIYALALSLTKLGHHVVIITNAYEKNRIGVRYISSGMMKVYYCPIRPMVDQVAMPTFTATLPLLRHIFVREGIQIIHAHQATSAMGSEAIVYASALGLKSVYTDHSLFGFDDTASIILNRVLQTTLSTVDACICVSHVCRDNLILRAQLPKQPNVIPNAIDSTKFTPSTAKTTDRITVVVVSRLVYRKGMDLLVGIIPEICNSLPQVDFLIAGDGNKRPKLNQIVEDHDLQSRVTFEGGVSHDQVRNVLIRGDIFLNCSLTESFCIAIVEAASCGLLVVATSVGGVPEVLPEDMILLSEPNVPDIVKAVKAAVDRQEGTNRVDSQDFHDRIKSMYSWSRVANETVQVYKQILQHRPPLDLWDRLGCYLKSLGLGISGLAVCLLVVTLELWLVFVEWWQPRGSIDAVPIIRRHDFEKLN